MKTNKIPGIILTLLFITFISSCVKEKLELTYNNQESKIDSYIEKQRYQTHTEDGETIQDTLRVAYKNGSNRLVRQEGIGEELNSKGIATLYYAGYIFQGSKTSSNLFATNHVETAKEAGWELSGEQTEILRINMADMELIEGLRNGLIGVKSGEHSEILFSGKYAFGKKPLGIIPANSAILYEIWVEAISND